MKIELKRFAYTPFGVFGTLYLSEFQCYTVERPWLGNEQKVSCIPEGLYKTRLGYFNRGGYDCYEILDVPDRSLIKIHIGNTMDDVLGCIALGLDLGCIGGKWAVLRSKLAYDNFMRSLSYSTFGHEILIYREIG